MEHDLTYDVAIVGARCSGAALALLLARAGLRVLVIDRASFPSDTHSTHGISTNGTELLHAWGVLDDVVALGSPTASEIRVSTPSQSLIVPTPSNGRGLTAPRRDVLDKLLVDLARGAGADVWENTTFEGLVSGGRAETVRGLRCRRADGGRVEVHALVVGADGVDSAVAAAVDAPTYAERPSACGAVYAYYLDSQVTEFGIGLAERRLALALPTTGGEVCFAIGGHDDDARHLSRCGDEAVVAFAEAFAPDLAVGLRRGRRTSRMFLARPRPGRYRVPHGPGWALVGDAGHYLDPFTGQGMSNAFLGADLLARALVAGLGGDGDLRQTLGEYHEQRDQLTRDVHEATHELAMFAWDEPRGIELVIAYRTFAEQTRQRILQMHTPAAA